MCTYKRVAHGVEWAVRFQIIRYGIAGGLSAAIDLGLFWLLNKHYGVWYLYATLLSGTIAWMVNFPLHKYWTFGDRRGKLQTTAQGVGHYTLKLWNTYLLVPFLLHLLVERTAQDPFWSKVFLAFAIGLIQNLPACRYLIFPKRPAL